MFGQTGMSIWNNCWSEYINFSKEDSTIFYFNPNENKEIFQKLDKELKDNEVNSLVYYPVPFTYGRSFTVEEFMKVNIEIFYFKEPFGNYSKYFCVN